MYLRSALRHFRDYYCITTTKLFFETYFVLSSLDAIFLSTGDGTHHTVIQFEPHGLTFARGLFQFDATFLRLNVRQFDVKHNFRGK